MSITKFKAILGTENIINLGVQAVDIATGVISYDKLDTNTKRTRREVRIPADSGVGDTWEKSVLRASLPISIADAGIIPDAVISGHATYYATLELQNKGIDGTGTASIVSKNFTAGVSGYAYTSFGTITSGDIASGEVVTTKKSVSETGSGQIVPASVIVLNIERKA